MTIKDQRRLDDHYSRKARKEGYPARSVWKLEEFDRKYGLFKPGQKVLDLGCAPGGWTLYAAAKVGAGGLALGYDLALPKGQKFPAQVVLREADLAEIDSAEAVDLGPFDAVLSDMAPKTTGRREIDQALSLRLCLIAWDWARKSAKKGGFFLLKIFQSPDGDRFLKSLEPYFRKRTLLKPQATRKESQEIYFLGQAFAGPEAAAAYEFVF